MSIGNRGRRLSNYLKTLVSVRYFRQSVGRIQLRWNVQMSKQDAPDTRSGEVRDDFWREIDPRTLPGHVALWT